MRTVRPVDPIKPARGVRRITLRRVPSFRQLRRWLAFARQKAKDGPARPPAAIAPQDAPADWESQAETATADPGHVAKRV
ncbi:MAG TPA: hypothetical protein VKY22_25175 [Bradyrhizobium sp.]|nr:hypothetical protein [Bradyrhizobium sp.]